MDIDPPPCVSAAVALPVTAGAEGGAPPEWALVELQGAVEPPAGTEEGADFTAGRLKLLVRGGGGGEGGGGGQVRVMGTRNRPPPPFFLSRPARSS